MDHSTTAARTKLQPHLPTILRGRFHDLARDLLEKEPAELTADHVRARLGEINDLLAQVYLPTVGNGDVGDRDALVTFLLEAANAIPSAVPPAPSSPTLKETVEAHVERHYGELSPAYEQIRSLTAKRDRAFFWVSPIVCGAGDVELMVLSEIAENPDLRVLIVRDDRFDAAQSVKRLRGVLKRHQSRRPEDQRGSFALTVERPSSLKDPTITATWFGGSLVGARLDRIYVVRSDKRRPSEWHDRALEWFVRNAMGRLTSEGRVYVFGAPHDDGDVALRLAADPGWSMLHFPLVNQTTGESLWPERYSAAQIANLRANMGPVEAARQIDCKLPSYA